MANAHLGTCDRHEGEHKERPECRRWQWLGPTTGQMVLGLGKLRQRLLGELDSLSGDAYAERLAVLRDIDSILEGKSFKP